MSSFTDNENIIFSWSRCEIRELDWFQPVMMSTSITKNQSGCLINSCHSNGNSKNWGIGRSKNQTFGSWTLSDSLMSHPDHHILSEFQFIVTEVKESSFVIHKFDVTESRQSRKYHMSNNVFTTCNF